ncbi:TolC family protein [Flavihumibacter rivuli]|uniref:TolC family protein n=1 Tax=Flavihumibacter rivuli TaxID=2838156 RepID=UPI001BDF498B|nr:TolC family protein [Flavihumibacter rivuli]ULQ54903.1 TolC family protein [Flavihumibacter rivuli]
MTRIHMNKAMGLLGGLLFFAACSIPPAVQKTPQTNTPASFAGSQDTVNSAQLNWRDYFKDPNLVALIDTALLHNQELNIMLQEIQVANNEIRIRKGEYLPFVNVRAGAGVEKVGRYTSQGANDANTEIKPGKEFPEPLGDLMVGVYASWEVDIWKKLHNAKKVAALKYLSTIEGRNFMVTHLVAEIANSYYELLALDNQLEILQQNIAIQQNALEIIRQEKQAARVTELAVKRFEAEVLKNQSQVYAIRQQIIETENRINFLVGRFPGPVARQSNQFNTALPEPIRTGVPSQLLVNRPDIRQAELELQANKLEVAIARANFYPSVSIVAGLGYRAFNPAYLFSTPESILYGLAGDLMAPLVNRNAIKANYANANAKQVQAVFNYERSILNGFIEVSNQLSKIENLKQGYALKDQQVAALAQSVAISGNLFKSARADYMEVLLTQRDVLEARMELVETRKEQLITLVNIYQALGGGWK